MQKKDERLQLKGQVQSAKCLPVGWVQSQDIKSVLVVEQVTDPRANT